MKRRPVLAALAAVVGLWLSASVAQALPLVGDQTIVLLTSEPVLTDAGISVAASGNALLGTDLAGRTEVLLPITGGDVDETTLSGTIEHAGSGVILGDVFGSTVEITDVVIDLDALVVTGDVSLDGGAPVNLELFDVASCTDLYGGADQCIDGDGSVLLDGWKLSVSVAAAAGLSAAFGVEFEPGAQAGVARIDIRTEAPEPGTTSLLGAAGAAAAAAAARRRRRR